MKRFAVLIVDPNHRHRTPLQARLNLSFQTVVVSSLEEAAATFELFHFSAVVASLCQERGHGLEVCQKLRELPGAQDCLMVVHGPIRGNPSCEALQRKWRTDVVIPFRADPLLLETLLWDRLLARRLVRRTGELTRPAPVSTMERRLARLRALLFSEFYLFPPPRPVAPSELTVLELLNSRPTLENLRVLVQRLSPRANVRVVAGH